MDPELHPPMLSVSWAPGHGATGTLRTNCASLYPMLDSLPLSRYHFRVTAGRARAALALALDDEQHWPDHGSIAAPKREKREATKHSARRQLAAMSSSDGEI
jgi:hypothetical protein